MTKIRRRLGVIGVLLAAAVLLVASGLALGCWLTRPSPAVTNLYSFRGGPEDGSTPWTLLQASDDVLYGTTWNRPLIFRFTPNGMFSVLARLRDAIGSGLVEGADGCLYALAMPGDALALCRFTRDGAASVLHSFGTPQGPAPGLLVGRDGHVYGLSVGDGTNKKGTFYRVIPGGDFTILHHFGPEEYAGSHLIQHSDGAFYGATWVGSVAFRVTTNGDFSVIARFRSGVCSTMVEAGDGNLYALIAPDASPFLALCRMVPDGEGTVLHRFDYDELLPPLASLMTSRDGQVYGLTRDTVYKLTWDDQLATVHEFPADQDRSRPRWGLTQHSDNAWYGVTEHGAEWGLGTVFRITPEGAYGRGGFHSRNRGTGLAQPGIATASGGRSALHPSAASRGGECREPAFTNKCTTATNLEGLSSLSY